jgi:hypothetical protein
MDALLSSLHSRVEGIFPWSRVRQGRRRLTKSAPGALALSSHLVGIEAVACLDCKMSGASRTAIQALYNNTLRTAGSFRSYNFRNYFVERTKRVFREIEVRSKASPFDYAEILIGYDRPSRILLNWTSSIGMRRRNLKY